MKCQYRLVSRLHSGLHLTCISTPKYAQTSGICASPSPSFALPAALPFAVAVCCSGSISSNTLRALFLGLGKAVRRAMARASGRLSALRIVDMLRNARRVNRGSNASTA